MKARVSNGELASVEIRGVATLKCEVINGRSPVMSWPRIETADALVTVAVGRPLEEALWSAFRDLILWVEELTGMSKEMPLTICVHPCPARKAVLRFVTLSTGALDWAGAT